MKLYGKYLIAGVVLITHAALFCKNDDQSLATMPTVYNAHLVKDRNYRNQSVIPVNADDQFFGVKAQFDVQRKIFENRLAIIKKGFSGLYGQLAYACNGMVNKVAQLIGHLKALHTKDDVKKFMEHFAPPNELVDLIKQNGNRALKSASRAMREGNTKESILQVNSQTSYIYKGSGIKAVERVINAYRCNQFFKKHGLDRLGTPEKYIVNINGELHVFAKVVGATNSPSIDNEDIRQLGFCTANINFTDWSIEKINSAIHHNIIQRDSDKKLIIIDTENLTFQHNLTTPYYSFRFNQKIMQFLEKYYELLAKKNGVHKIYQTSEYDGEFDLVKIKQDLFK